jgi:Zn-dependent protease with chaperone function
LTGDASEVSRRARRARASGLAIALLVTSASWAQSGVKPAAAALPDALEAGWRGTPVCERLHQQEGWRVLRCRFEPGVGHERHFHGRHFGYALSGGRVRITDAAGTREVDLATGSSFSSDGVPWHEVLNVGTTPVVYLIVESEAAGGDAVSVPAPSPEAMRFYRSGMWLWALGLVWGFAVLAAWLFTGASARLRALAARWAGGRWYPTVAIYLLLFLAIGYVVDLPLAYYIEYVRAHAYGLSNQTPGRWLGESLTALAVVAAGALAFGWVPFLLLARSPRRWWLGCALLSVPLVAFLTLVQPIWVDPLFNEFGPMRDATLERDILALAERAGIEGSRVFEVDQSVDTETVNAYVTGIGATHRIVLWDTLIAKLPRESLLFVMAHEMGHYVLDHLWKLLVLAPLLVLAGLWLIHRTSGAILRRWGARFGFSTLADVAALPLLALLFGLFLFAVSPLVLAWSRSLEHEADRFGLELTRDHRAAALAFVALQEENLGNPRPGWVYRTWRASHPSLGDRIDFCNGYRPWEKGEPLVYGERFR